MKTYILFWLAKHISTFMFVACVVLGMGITFVIYVISNLIGDAITEYQMKRDKK